MGSIVANVRGISELPKRTHGTVIADIQRIHRQSSGSFQRCYADEVVELYTESIANAARVGGWILELQMVQKHAAELYAPRKCRHQMNPSLHKPIQRFYADEVVNHLRNQRRSD